MTRSLTLLALSIVTVTAGSAFAQCLPGDAKSETKLSSSAGGLTTSIANLDKFGADVTGFDDLDGDGVPDLAVGIPGSDVSGFSEGTILILFLNANGTVKAEQLITEGVGGFTGTLDSTDGLGAVLAPMADPDGDTVPELRADVPTDDEGGKNKGAVWRREVDAVAGWNRSQVDLLYSLGEIGPGSAAPSDDG